MYEQLNDFFQRPSPFSKYTVKELWTRPHLSRQMLNHHLDQSSDLASWKLSSIERVVDWIDSQFELTNNNLCDLGCGPGLYATRFAKKGAKVTGVDFPSHSIEYARSQSDGAKSANNYLIADYLTGELPKPFDIVTLIFCNYCALSPLQRRTLLSRIFEMLAPDGHLVMDVLAANALKQKTEKTIIEEKLMNGFWAETDYIGIQHSFVYPESRLSLDRYLIIEPNETWEILNWLQHFSLPGIESELKQAGFEITKVAAALTGEALTTDSDVIGIIARKK